MSTLDPDVMPGDLTVSIWWNLEAASVPTHILGELVDRDILYWDEDPAGDGSCPGEYALDVAGEADPWARLDAAVTELTGEGVNPA